MRVNKSYVGSIANPIAETRVGLAMSGAALAKRLGLSRQYIQKAEEGIYTSLNPSLLKWTAEVNGFTVNAVAKRYKAFQNAQRRETIERVQPHPFTLTEPEGFHFERWRSGYWTSSGQFAVAFCIHPDLIQKYEEGITKSMPKQLKLILEAHGLLKMPLEAEALRGPLTPSQEDPFL